MALYWTVTVPLEDFFGVKLSYHHYLWLGKVLLKISRLAQHLGTGYARERGGYILTRGRVSSTRQIVRCIGTSELEIRVHFEDYSLHPILGSTFDYSLETHDGCMQVRRV